MALFIVGRLISGWIFMASDTDSYVSINCNVSGFIFCNLGPNDGKGWLKPVTDGLTVSCWRSSLFWDSNVSSLETTVFNKPYISVINGFVLFSKDANNLSFSISCSW